ncbi:hypothetical protein A2U01_0095262 [Trifolium medium]|uniref:Uncharacterized protein n=1 Tax=Trifolium medium TaxID=97028 RepID=A0A392UM80_9FABA|nr:hypothetical protein [Trifolium medium]
MAAHNIQFQQQMVAQNMQFQQTTDASIFVSAGSPYVLAIPVSCVRSMARPPPKPPDIDAPAATP